MMEEYIQKNKLDYWLCSCKSYHKGFPYECPIKQLKADHEKEIENVFNDIECMPEFIICTDKKCPECKEYNRIKNKHVTPNSEAKE